jgi:dTDP-4-dehydrorhamnose 3,5-epimerase
MTIVETALEGVFLIEPQLHADRRGFFARLYDEDELSSFGIETRVAQYAVSFNESAATLRGLHYQEAPYGETKVVRCTSGMLFDVVADLRAASPTRYQWIGYELSAANRRCLIVPPGCAHGFLTLVDATEITYLISVPYVAEAQRGVRWDDPMLKISWPAAPKVIGERDTALAFLQS